MTTVKKEHPLYLWEEVEVIVRDQMAFSDILNNQSMSINIVGTPISKISHYILFVTLASVSFRIKESWKPVYSILNGLLLPTDIYLFISRDSYLLDSGVTEIPDVLLSLVAQKHLHIVYTTNIGPHRKLLPLLANHFNNPHSLLVTVDDDITYGSRNSALLLRLFQKFLELNESSVVTSRVHGFGLCRNKSDVFPPYKTWSFGTDGKDSGMCS